MKSTRLKVSCKKGTKSTRKFALIYKTAFSKQRTWIGIISYIQHATLLSFNYGAWVSRIKVIYVRLGVKFQSLSRERKCRHVRLNTKKGVSLKENVLNCSDPWILNDDWHSWDPLWLFQKLWKLSYKGYICVRRNISATGLCGHAHSQYNCRYSLYTHTSKRKRIDKVE